MIPDEPEEDDPVILMYTGGTTGLPKGVLLDHRAEMLNLYHVMQAWRFSADDVFLHQTPMFHAASMGGMLGVPAQGGASVFLSLFDPGARARTVRAALGHADGDGADDDRHVAEPPDVPARAARAAAHAHLRRVADAGARCSIGCSPTFPTLDVFQGYGMTESSAVLTALGPDEHRAGGARLRSAGRPLPGVVLSIQDPDGKPCCRRARPARCARAAATSCGSTGSSPRRPPTRSAAAGTTPATPATSTRDGYLFLVDRVKDMIVTGGENVYSVEVENAIASHPAVAQVAVIGIPSEKWGEAVHAIVVPKAGHDRDRGRDHRARPRADRRLQGAEVGGVPDRAAAAVGRDEGAEARSPRAVLGRPRPRPSTSAVPPRAAPRPGAGVVPDY